MDQLSFSNISINSSFQRSARIDNKIFLKGMKWANPIEEDFKRKVNKFYNSTSIPKEWANELKNKLENNNKRRFRTSSVFRESYNGCNENITILS